MWHSVDRLVPTVRSSFRRRGKAVAYAGMNVGRGMAMTGVDNRSGCAERTSTDAA